MQFCTRLADKSILRLTIFLLIDTPWWVLCLPYHETMKYERIYFHTPQPWQIKERCLKVIYTITVCLNKCVNGCQHQRKVPPACAFIFITVMEQEFFFIFITVMDRRFWGCYLHIKNNETQYVKVMQFSDFRWKSIHPSIHHWCANTCYLPWVQLTMAGCGRHNPPGDENPLLRAVRS